MALQSLALLSSLGLASAFPWVASMPGVDSSLLRSRDPEKRQTYAYGTCPNNPNHAGAVPFNSKYPYSYAQNGAPGTQIGGVLVPADGDTAHYYTAPGPNDIRGPCPGLNAAANHNFLSHDGITTFDELVDTQQNVYGVGYDLAVLLATLGVGLDGDVVTEKLSLGCDATPRTGLGGDPLGDELGLNGHNKFEGDTSLTRNDFFTHGGDNYMFNGTLFEMMRQASQTSGGGLFNRQTMSDYRYQRYIQSRSENPNFYFGPKSLLLFGASSFLYELFPSFGDQGPADLATISSFFGAQSTGNGGWKDVGDQIPANWFSRKAPYTIPDVAAEIYAQYMAHPVEFGGNVGTNNFNGNTTFGMIQNGKIPSSATAADFTCFLYQLATENVPASLSTVLELPLEVLEYTTSKLNPIFKNFGCPLKLT